MQVWGVGKCGPDMQLSGDLRLDAIVLAAGMGKRFGGNKLTTPWRGGVLLDGALATAFAAPVRRVTVVIGANPGVGPAARAFAETVQATDRLRLAPAGDFTLGLSASLRAGIVALPGDCDGVFVFLGDMPAIPPDISYALAAALAQGAQVAAPIFEGRRGHPALFHRDQFTKLCNLSGDDGAKGVFETLDAGLVLVETDDRGVLLDVDRPADLEPGRGWE